MGEERPLCILEGRWTRDQTEIWLRCLAWWRLPVLILDMGLQSKHSSRVLQGGVLPFPAYTKSVQLLSHSGRGECFEGESPVQDQAVKTLCGCTHPSCLQFPSRPKGAGISPFPKRSHKAGFMLTVKPLVFLNP